MQPSRRALLLVTVTFLVAILLWPYISQSIRLSQLKPRKLLKSISLPGKQRETCAQRGYTIIVSSYDRVEELNITLKHWRSCPYVKQVQVVWHNPANPFPAALLDGLDDVVVRAYPDNKLTNRFQTSSEGLAEFHTDALFSVDDDEAIDCRLMTAAFKLWCSREDAGKPSVVGFEPRNFDVLSSLPSNDQGYIWDASCKGNCTYNTVWTTKGAFMHARYYTTYWDAAYVSLRAAVDKAITGEDMLMSAILMEQQVPVVVLHPAPHLKLRRGIIPRHLKRMHVPLGRRTASQRGQIRTQLQQFFAGKTLSREGTTEWHILQRNGTINIMQKPCQQFRVKCSN